MSRSLKQVCLRTGAVGLMFIFGLALAACSSMPERKTLNDAQFEERSEIELAAQTESFHASVGRLVQSMRNEQETAAPGSQVTLNFLALSGGGDYGAFGAGFLVGWGESHDPAHRRPDFDVVSGVSTGALLAPFAFVGTDESCRTVENFYRNPEKDWVEDRGLLFFLPSNASFMVIPRLEASLKTAITPELVDQMAAKSRRGKFLAISATDLDYGRQHIWDLGTEAEHAAAKSDSERLRRIMLASAAIPVAFPPIEIDGSLFADGGVTANVLVKLDPRSPQGFIQTWKRNYPGVAFPSVRYWIIINNSLSQPPKTVQPKWPEVLSPSLATSIRSATIAEVRWLAAQADYVNCAYGTDIEVRLVAIPDSWRPPVQGDFQKATMDSLADLGRKLAADPNSWTLMTTPRDAKP